MSSDFIMRASSFPNFVDCQRRWAGENIRSIREKCLLEREATRNKKTKQIGALFGTAAHFGSELMLKDKQAGRKVDWRRAVAQAQDVLREDIFKCGWDAATKSPTTAMNQIESVLAEFADKYIIPRAIPMIIETELEMRWAGRVGDMRVLVRGKPDFITEDLDVPDTKFGSKLSGPLAQLGIYLWLVQAKFVKDIVGGGCVLWTPRTGENAPQRPLQVLHYDREACLDVAEKAVNDCVRSSDEYVRTENLWAFSANSNSKYCTRKTCLVFGTSQCDQWIVEIEQENDECQEL